MYKYIAIDFDGTLLRSNHNISARSVEVLKELQEAGIKVLLCSGRNVSQMNFVAEKIDSDKYHTYIISDNGGVITKVETETERSVLRSTLFDDEQVRDLVKMLSGRTKILATFKDGVRYLAKPNVIEMFRAYMRYKEFSKIGIPAKASKMLLIDSVYNINEQYEDIKNMVLAEYPTLNVFRSVPTLIEITPNGSTKGQGLQFVFEKNGWSLDELIVFGDGENDISMFEVAGHAVAMENAFDTVKAKANDITLSNDEDGVAVYLEKIYTNILK